MSRTVPLVLATIISISANQASSETLVVTCVADKGQGVENLEYVVDTDRPLKGFLDGDIETWQIVGENLVGITESGRQGLINKMTNQVSFDGETLPKEKISCGWEVQPSNEAASPDISLDDLLVRIEELEKRVTAIEDN